MFCLQEHLSVFLWAKMYTFIIDYNEEHLHGGIPCWVEINELNLNKLLKVSSMSSPVSVLHSNIEN